MEVIKFRLSKLTLNSRINKTLVSFTSLLVLVNVKKVGSGVIYNI